jgi:hypothetical protein
MNRRSFLTRSIPAVPGILLGSSEASACLRRRRSSIATPQDCSLASAARYTPEFYDDWSDDFFTPEPPVIRTFRFTGTTESGIRAFRIELWWSREFGHIFHYGFDVQNANGTADFKLFHNYQYGIVVFSEPGHSHQGSPQMRRTYHNGSYTNLRTLRFERGSNRVQVTYRML